MKRFIPLALVSVALINFVMPGTLGALGASFRDPGGALEQQELNPDDPTSAGRVADLGPSLQEFARGRCWAWGQGLGS